MGTELVFDQNEGYEPRSRSRENACFYACLPAFVIDGSESTGSVRSSAPVYVAGSIAYFGSRGSGTSFD